MHALVLPQASLTEGELLSVDLDVFCGLREAGVGVRAPRTRPAGLAPPPTRPPPPASCAPSVGMRCWPRPSQLDYRPQGARCREPRVEQCSVPTTELSIVSAATCHRKQLILVIRLGRQCDLSGCQNSRAVVSSVILNAVVQRAWWPTRTCAVSRPAQRRRGAGVLAGRAVAVLAVRAPRGEEPRPRVRFFLSNCPSSCRTARAETERGFVRGARRDRVFPRRTQHGLSG